MDPRCNPTDFWNLGEDGPPVVRNAGGGVTEDALRSVRTLAAIMGNGQNTVGVGMLFLHVVCEVGSGFEMADCWCQLRLYIIRIAA
jgi:hypothetical protein